MLPPTENTWYAKDRKMPVLNGASFIDSFLSVKNLFLKISSVQARALAYLRKHQSMTTSDYLKINPEVTPRTAHTDLTGPAKLKIVQPEGTKRWRRYVLSEM